MGEYLTKIVQTWCDEVTGSTTEKTITYDQSGKKTGESEKVGGKGKKGEVGAESDADTPSLSSGAGIGQEGLVVADPDKPMGSHVTTDGSLAPGAVKAAEVLPGAEVVSDNTVKGEVLKGRLAPDFPAIADLNAAGIHTYGQLSKHKGDYTAIPNVGEAKAKRIAEALGE
jgi:hypothetical protein